MFDQTSPEAMEQYAEMQRQSLRMQCLQQAAGLASISGPTDAKSVVETARKLYDFVAGNA